MNDRRLAFLYAPEIEELRYPEDCPYQTQRATLTRRRLLAFGWLGHPGRDQLPARQASIPELLQAHSAAYLTELQRAAGGQLSPEGVDMGLGGHDTPVFADMFTYGSWAAGAALTGAEHLLQQRTDVAFSLLGGFHHARPSHASRFCYLNDVVLACKHLAAAGKRVACVDIDAHHGDAVQEAFYRRNDVMTISLHESGESLFPGGGFEHEIGECEGLGFNANVCLPVGSYDRAFLYAFDQVVMPLLGACNPDVIVLDLGMDTLAGDPLTHLHMTNNIVVDAMTRLLWLDRPLLVLAGGGYHVENTVRGWALAWGTAAGEADEDALNAGLGGAMIRSSEWTGGLRDAELEVSEEQRKNLMPRVEASVAAVAANVFPYHGLSIPAI